MKRSSMVLKIQELNNEFVITVNFKNDLGIGLDFIASRKIQILNQDKNSIVLQLKKSDFKFLTKEIIQKAFLISEEKINNYKNK